MKNCRIIFLGLLISHSSFAYNSARCKAYVNRQSFEFAYALSTTSFLSSTSECRLIGKVEHDKQVFIVHNYDHIMKESSQGQGEYILAFAKVAGCDIPSGLQLPRILQKNFKQIYGGFPEKNSEQVYLNVNEVIKNDPILSIGCKIGA